MNWKMGKLYVIDIDLTWMLAIDVKNNAQSWSKSVFFAKTPVFHDKSGQIFFFPHLAPQRFTY